MIQVAFGTSKLLCFERFDQAIVDFNLTQGTFSFIDRDDLKLAGESRQSALAEYFFKSGAVNGFDAIAAKEALFKELEVNSAVKDFKGMMPIPLKNMIFD